MPGVSTLKPEPQHLSEVGVEPNISKEEGLFCCGSGFSVGIAYEIVLGTELRLETTVVPLTNRGYRAYLRSPSFLYVKMISVRKLPALERARRSCAQMTPTARSDSRTPPRCIPVKTNE